MKTLLLIFSGIASFLVAYVFVINLKYSFELNYILFMSLLILLFLVFITLSILIYTKKTKSKTLFYNSYSNKRTKNDGSDKFYNFLEK